jgi:hypothetical protein
VQQLSLQDGVPRALAGGVLHCSTILQASFSRTVNLHELRFDPLKLVYDPAQGAVKTAQRM